MINTPSPRSDPSSDKTQVGYSREKDSQNAKLMLTCPIHVPPLSHPSLFHPWAFIIIIVTDSDPPHSSALLAPTWHNGHEDCCHQASVAVLELAPKQVGHHCLHKHTHMEVFLGGWVYIAVMPEWLRVTLIEAARQAVSIVGPKSHAHPIGTHNMNPISGLMALHLSYYPPICCAVPC